MILEEHLDAPVEFRKWLRVLKDQMPENPTGEFEDPFQYLQEWIELFEKVCTELLLVPVRIEFYNKKVTIS